MRHILIAVPAGADAKTDAAAKAKAEDLLKQIKAGGNFADLAAKNSDDPGSKTQGGELGRLIPTAGLDPEYRQGGDGAESGADLGCGEVAVRLSHSPDGGEEDGAY